MATASIAGVPYRPPLATGTPTTPQSSPTINYDTSTAQPGNTYTYLYYFIVPYLDAHVLSPPSWRYAYIFWIFVPVSLAIWSAIYQLDRYVALRSHTPLATPSSNLVSNQRSNLRFHPIRWIRAFLIPRLIPPSSITHPHQFTNFFRFYSSNITVGQVITLLTFTIIMLAISLVGDDYISPTTCTWGGRCPVQVFNQGPPKSTYAPNFRRFRARRSDRNATPQLANPFDPQALMEYHKIILPRATALNLNPDGWAPFTDPLLSAPNTNVPRNMWTISSRFGLIAYAMIPFVVSIGLKSWPFNIFATPWLTNYGFDRTSILHRWTGRLIWVWSTIHTITFSIQLSRDINPYGHTILTDVWQYYRFNWGVVAYVALTITVCFSFNPLRNRYYEFFYCSHVVLSIIFLVGCIIHYEPLWAWAVIGLALWGAERACRLVVWLWFNGFFCAPTKFWSNQPSVSSPRIYQSDPEKPVPVSSQVSNQPYTDIRHSYPPAFNSLAHDSTACLPSTIENQTGNPFQATLSSSEVPPGFALVQVLPGHTLRISLKMVKEAKWQIGQYVLLCVPSVSWWQTHPYTISCSSLTSDCAMSHCQSSGKELVLLLRARQGFSKKFYEFVLSQKTHSFHNVGSAQINSGILIRCQISRPLGSSERIMWDSMDSTIIVCGGSGISFGISALEEICFKMHQRSQESSTTPKLFKTRTSRVRLVWIFREYAHLTWVALALKRCLTMVSYEQLQIDLHVSNSLRQSKPFRAHWELADIAQSSATNRKTEATDSETLLAPPHPAFLRIDSDSDFSSSSRRGSLTGSITLADSESTHISEYQDATTELTDFEGENQGGSDAEIVVSTNVKREGTRRRRYTLTRAKERLSNAKEMFTLRENVQVPADNKPEETKDSTFNGNPESDQMRLNDPYDKPTVHEIENYNEKTRKNDLFREMGIDLSLEERLALEELSEYIQTGRPSLGQILRTEVKRSLGKTLVACCGPETLNGFMRSLVSQQLLHPQDGQCHKHIDIYTEDFSY